MRSLRPVAPGALSGAPAALQPRENRAGTRERLLLPEGSLRARAERAEEREWTPGPWLLGPAPAGADWRPWLAPGALLSLRQQTDSQTGG